jgi:hypothetical protein
MMDNIKDFIGFIAAFLLVAPCGSDVYREFLRQFHSVPFASISAFVVPLGLIWLAGNWIVNSELKRFVSRTLKV